MDEIRRGLKRPKQKEPTAESEEEMHEKKSKEQGDEELEEKGVQQFTSSADAEPITDLTEAERNVMEAKKNLAEAEKKLADSKAKIQSKSSPDAKRPGRRKQRGDITGPYSQNIVPSQWGMSPSTNAQNYTTSWPYMLITKKVDIRVGRCDTKGLPLSVLHDVFGMFSAESSSSVTDTELELTKAAEFLQRLSKDMCKYYDTEAERAHALREHFLQFFEGVSIACTEGTEGSVTLTVFTKKNEKWLMITCVVIEAKKELGSTGSDPFMQALAYSIKSYAAGIKNGLDCSIPCFHIVMAGPHFGISGCINAITFVQYQQLTPLFSLVCLPGCGFSHDLLCYVIALKKAFKKVYYGIEHKMMSDYPYFLEFGMDGKAYKIKYMRRIQNLVFQATLTDTDGKSTRLVVVKFASQYGLDAHRFCVSEGYAPNIIYHTYAPPWHIVVMDFWNLGQLVTSPSDEQKLNLKEFLQKLHSADYVHGDLRQGNVFIKIDGGSGIAILDFDWAGKLHSVKYPLTLNLDIPWPTDARPGRYITKEHDTYWISKMINMQLP